MIDLIIGVLIGLAVAAAYHRVFRPFMKNLFSKEIMRNNYKKRKKLGRAVIFKPRLFFRIAIKKLKKQQREEDLKNGK